MCVGPCGPLAARLPGRRVDATLAAVRRRCTRLLAGPGRTPPGIHHVAFAVEDIDAVVAGLRARGAELVGELERYEDSYRLCYVRGLIERFQGQVMKRKSPHRRLGFPSQPPVRPQTRCRTVYRDLWVGVGLGLLDVYPYLDQTRPVRDG
jgi:catechol 2,3-dioxygenase-like lactoylglutathione lyase family enzyme